MGAEVQPHSLPWMSASTSAKRPTAEMRMPGRSIAVALGLRASGGDDEGQG